MKKALLILFALLATFTLLISCDNSVDYPFEDDAPASETPEMVALTFEFIKDGKITITNIPAGMKYSKNGGEKQAAKAEIIVEAGDRIKFYADRSSVEPDKYLNINSSGDCYVYGNVMSLFVESGFENKKDVVSEAFRNLFKGNAHIRLHDEKKLVLPAETLKDYCYAGMFSGCTALTSTPVLAVETLAEGCYNEMFSGCTGLKSAPSLPAEELAPHCYEGMFSGCTGLTAAPLLLVTDLKPYCYANMFKGCTNLTYVPTLPAEDLIDHCYAGMFNGCNKLAAITCLATRIDDSATLGWVKDVAPVGVFTKATGMIGWTIGDNGIPRGWVIYNYDDTPIPLTLEFSKSGTLSFDNAEVNNLKFSKNKEAIEPVTGDIVVEAGDRIELFATRTSVPSGSYLRIHCDANCYVYGNVMSLIKEEGFDEVTAAFSDCFRELFKGNTYIRSHYLESLILPATELAGSCYESMFEDCKKLSTAPELPATSMYTNCYNAMFKGCISLTDAPELPATSLSNTCYSNMFEGCTSLSAAPELPAEILKEYCYREMFKGCKSLKSAPFLPASIMVKNCYEGMFENCTRLENAPILRSLKLGLECYSRMFKGCSSLKEAPALPAEELASYCYYSMFSGCRSLAEAPELPATTLKSYCYNLMFENCISLTSAPVLEAEKLEAGCYKEMFKGCKNLNYVTCFATDISATDATSNWLADVAPSGTFMKEVGMNAWTLNSPSGVPEGWTVIDNAGPLTLEFIEYGTLWFDYAPSTLMYSKNGGAKQKVSGSIIVYPNDVISLYADRESVSGSNYLRIRCNSECYVYGNVMSLIKADEYGSEKSVFSSAFRNLFLKNTYIQNHPTKDLVLPATTLADYCYANMFEGCTSLSTLKVLPAITLVDNCYQGMFKGCTSLVTAPALPATTLEYYCYANMFEGCTSLTTIEGLPATTLVNNCYQGMFKGCTSLVTAPALSATTLAYSCCSNMFEGCTSLKTAPALPVTTLAERCYMSMFEGCTSLVTAPTLPATALAESCYKSMFKGCTSLKPAPALSAGTLAKSCYESMFEGCTSLTEMPDLPAMNLAIRCYNSMFNGCTSLSTLKKLPATTLADGDGSQDGGCYSLMFKGCKYITSIPENMLPASDLEGKDYCYSSMFAKCTGLTTVPEGLLPAKTLAYRCYLSMFDECSGITSVPAKLLPATEMADGCYYRMLAYTSITEGPDLPATKMAPYCYAGLFAGCKKLIESPVLLAENISREEFRNCYKEMFSGCTSLKKITCHAKNPNTNALEWWVNFVPSGGTFYKISGISYPTTGDKTSTIPQGWTVVDI